MKLSEMTVEKAFDKVVELVPHITNILKNEEIKKLMKKVEITGATEEEKLNNSFNANIDKVIPLVNLVFKECKKDLFSIVAIMEDKTLKEVKGMNLIDFIGTSIDIFKDEDLIKLFTQRIGLKVKL